MNVKDITSANRHQLANVENGLIDINCHLYKMHRTDSRNDEFQSYSEPNPILCFDSRGNVIVNRVLPDIFDANCSASHYLPGRLQIWKWLTEPVIFQLSLRTSLLFLKFVARVAPAQLTIMDDGNAGFAS